MQVFLMRHPQPAVASSVCYGQTDVALAEYVQRKLALVASDLRQQLPDNIPLFSSPLLRCRLLAELLHPAVLYDARLQEMHFGQWEMMPWSDVPRHELDGWAEDILHYVPPSGESVAQLQQRVVAFMQEQALQYASIAIVSHAGVIKLLLAQARKLPLSSWASMNIDYGSLHMIEWT